jgi:curli production assembly/transport component CsgE
MVIDLKKIIVIFSALFLVFNHGQLPAQDTSRTGQDSITTQQDLQTKKKLESMLKDVIRDTKKYAKKSQETDPYALEIDGLIIDETMTKIGQDFYRIFYSRWTAPEQVSGFTIYILEQPMPRMGSRISIKINDKIVYRGMLKPRYDVIEQTVEQIIPQIKDYLIKDRQNRRQLSGEDMSGSGIY